MEKKLEILAPAGSLQGLKAAVAAGCDAVYIGGSRFGARAYADNPAEEEMMEAIAYCHLRGVKLYMTVNTLLKDKEIEESLFSFLRPYYKAGLDAVIVQDTGVLRFVYRHFPELPIHASTQMTLTMGKSAEILKKYHVTRIVPARELTIGELRRMRNDTDLELEVFVHGALCYCYSGQCLFSSMMGGRSGNRGRCAQPCRMPYKIEGNSVSGGRRTEGDYLLSPKELCNLPLLPDLVEAGVNSFKIEGRMKRPEYAAFVTSVYRKYVDLYNKYGKEEYTEYLSRHDMEWREDLRKLAELYNRNGFTQGYLEGAAGNPQTGMAGRKGQMLASHRPKHGGMLVGKVLSVEKGFVVYRTTKKISAHDVVEFRDERQNPSYEYTIGSDIEAGKSVRARYQKGCRIKTGDLVYRTKDAALLEEIRQDFLIKNSQIPAQAVFTAVRGKPLCLQASVETMTPSSVFHAKCQGGICQEAQSQPAEEDSVKKILNQTGNSPFYFDKLDMILDEGLFLPVGEIKKLRRQVLEELQETILSSQYREDAVLLPEQGGEKHASGGQMAGRTAFSASVMLPEQLTEVLNHSKIQTVYLHTEVMDGSELKKAYGRILEAGKSPWLILPAIFRSAVWERFAREWEQRDELFLPDWNGYLVKNMESFCFLTEIAGIPKENIRLDYNMYVMNEQAYAFWHEQGIDKVTLPLEAARQEIEAFSFLPQAELLIYGKVPLMVSAQCVKSNTAGCTAGRGAEVLMLKDGKKREFEAVNYCRYCYNVIYKKEPLYLKEVADKNQKPVCSAMRYSFTTESGAETADILRGTFEEENWNGRFRLGIQ